MSANQKVVFVTGSSRGIGRETVARLGERGHIVHAGVRDPNGRNKAAAQSIRGLGEHVHVVDADVLLERSVQSAVDRIVADDGRLDVVVNNAGIMNVGLVEGFTPDQLQHQMDVNYLGPARVFRAAIPVMRLGDLDHRELKPRPRSSRGERRTGARPPQTTRLPRKGPIPTLDPCIMCRGVFA